MDEKLKNILRDEFSEEVLGNPSWVTAVQSKLEKERSQRSSMFTTLLFLLFSGVCAAQVMLGISFFNTPMVVGYTVLAVVVALFYFLMCEMLPTVNMYRKAFREVVAERKDDDPLVADDDVEKIVVTEFRFSPQTICFSLQQRISFFPERSFMRIGEDEFYSPVESDEYEPTEAEESLAHKILRTKGVGVYLILKPFDVIFHVERAFDKKATIEAVLEIVKDAFYNKKDVPIVYTEEGAFFG
jgi:hypothetical protein